ncbi:hypothetical protein LJC49_00505 [Ruminococcaceae bacterium OttesenSCG-928-I18]|nr:hypothetical protein [Ruminococcaceae bacterium OttesenSCG-928-I18]
MKGWRKKHPSLFLLFACYVLCLLAAVLVGLGQFAYNRVLYQNGTLETVRLTAADFTLQQMEPMEGGFLTTGGDPQMILTDTERRVDTVRTKMRYRTEPLVETAFYAKPGEPYSVRRMVYAQQRGQDRVYELPAGGRQGLRIDPDSAAGNLLWVDEVILNERRPFYRFFIPSATEGAVLLAGPALLAGGIALCRQGLGALKGRKGVPRND